MGIGKIDGNSTVYTPSAEEAADGPFPPLFPGPGSGTQTPPTPPLYPGPGSHVPSDSGAGGAGGGGTQGASGNSGVPPTYQEYEFQHDLETKAPILAGIAVGAGAGPLGAAMGAVAGEVGESYLDAFHPPMTPEEYDKWVAENYPSSSPPPVGEDGFDINDYAVAHK
jgi:hypothetical protein